MRQHLGIGFRLIATHRHFGSLANVTDDAGLSEALPMRKQWSDRIIGGHRGAAVQRAGPRPCDDLSCGFGRDAGPRQDFNAIVRLRAE